jgi:hypothetical protein
MNLLKQSDTFLHITLSEANLLALLHKVKDPSSAATIYRRIGDVTVMVTGELDADHYIDRERGIMRADAEAFIKQQQEGAGAKSQTDSN